VKLLQHGNDPSGEFNPYFTKVYANISAEKVAAIKQLARVLSRTQIINPDENYHSDINLKNGRDCISRVVDRG
jgi:hypothetical protein